MDGRYGSGPTESAELWHICPFFSGPVTDFFPRMVYILTLLCVLKAYLVCSAQHIHLAAKV